MSNLVKPLFKPTESPVFGYKGFAANKKLEANSKGDLCTPTTIVLPQQLYNRSKTISNHTVRNVVTKTRHLFRGMSDV